jgi:hypothetical protein
VCWALATGLTAVVTAVLCLGVTPSTLRQRWTTGGDDQILHYMVTTTAAKGSPYLPNHLLGFPRSQDLFFAPIFDVASAIEMDVLAVFFQNGIVLYNVYLVLGFLLTGIAGFLALRVYDVGRPVSAAFGLVFALAPYHFQRIGVGHGFVSSYWSIAFISMALALVAGIDGPLQRFIARGASTRAVVRRGALVSVAVALPITLGLNYYFVFAILVLAGVLGVRVLVGVVAGNRLSGLMWPCATLGTLVALAGAQLAVLSLDFGDRYENYFAARQLLETELYGGKLSTLLLPWSGSHLPALGDLARRYLAESYLLPASEPPGTPVLAAVGMALATMFLVARGLGGRLPSWLEDRRLGALAAGLVWSLLFFLSGGLSALFAITVSGDIRAWSRLSILMILLALTFLAVLVDRLAGRRAVLAVALVIVLALAGVDQLWGVRSTVALSPTEDRPLRQLVARVDRLEADGCGVVELPLKSFPESPKILDLNDYDLALPYLYSGTSIRWSYGAVRGTRDGDYWNKVTDPQQFASAVTSSGACGVLVDTAGYEPDGWVPWVDPVTDTVPDVRSHGDDRRYLYFDIT